MPYRRKITTNSIISRTFIFLGTLVLLVLIWYVREDVLKRQYYGYLGIFIVNFITNATVLFPFPGVATVFLGGAIWNPLLVGIISGTGSTMGELFSYLIGYGSRGLANSLEFRKDWLRKVKYLFHKTGFIPVFLFSALPLPFFDFIGILSGAVDYPLWKFTVATLTGRILRNVFIAWTGAKMLP